MSVDILSEFEPPASVNVLDEFDEPEAPPAKNAAPLSAPVTVWGKTADLGKRFATSIAENTADAATGVLQAADDFTETPVTILKGKPFSQGNAAEYSLLSQSLDEIRELNARTVEGGGGLPDPQETRLLHRLGELEADPTKKRSLEEAADFMRDVSGRAKADYGVNPALDNDLSSKVVSGLGSVVPVIASGPMAPLTAAGMMGEQGRRDAEESGATPEQQKQSFYLNAGVGVLSEALMGVPALLRSARAAKMKPSTYRELVVAATKQAGKSFVREGSQEAIEQTAQNTIANAIVGYDSERGTFSGVPEAFFIGGLVGAPVGATVQVAQDLPGIKAPDVAASGLPLTADALRSTAPASPAPSVEVTTPAEATATVPDALATDEEIAAAITEPIVNDAIDTPAAAAAADTDEIVYSEMDTGGGMPNEAELESGEIDPADASVSTLEGYPVVEVPMSELTLSADVPNFKSDADEETGVVKGQQLEGKYERLGTGAITVWQRSDGKKEVVTGRHRFDLANRTKEQTIPSQIIRESDGWTKQKVARLDAEANIRDGQGSIRDYANYFRNSEGSEQDAETGGLLARSKGRAGYALGRHASDDLYALYQAEKLKESHAVAIVSAAPNNAGAQRAGVAFSKKNANASIAEIRAATEVSIAAAEGLPQVEVDQLEMWDSGNAETQAMERATQFVVELRKTAEQDVSVLSQAKKKRDALKLTPAEAKRFGIQDRHSIYEIDTALKRAQQDATGWDRWYLDPKKKAEVFAKAGIGEKALPTLRSGEKQGDLLSTQTEDLTLVGESGTDTAKQAAEKAAAEQAAAEAKASQDRDQTTLFSYTPKVSSAVRWERGPNHRAKIVHVVEMLKRSVEGVRVRVLATEADLPADVRAKLDPDGRYEGLVDTTTGDVWLFSDRISSPARAAEVFAHEVVGHYGVEKIADPKEWASLADSIIKRGGQQLGFVLNRNFPEKLVEELSPEERNILAKEYVATLAENPSSNPSLWQRVVTVVRRALRKLGIVREWTEADIRSLITQGARAVQDTGKSRLVGDGGYLTSRLPTSTKNEVTDAERAGRGASEIEAEARITNQESLDRARADLEANPNRGQEVVARLLSGETVRNISVDEEAILLVEKVRLLNERDAQGERASDTKATPEARAVARQEWQTLEGKINEMDQATHASGAEWGRMGQFRQRLLAADFTFEAMERRARAEKGDALTAEESATIKAQAVEIARLEGELVTLRAQLDAKASEEAFTEAQKEIEKEAAEEPEEEGEVDPKVASLASRIASAFEQQANAARARIREKMARMGAGVDPTILTDVAIIGADKIIKGARAFSKWSSEMLSDLGDWMAPHLQEVWDAANLKLDKAVEKVAKGDSRKIKRAVRKLDPQAGVDRVTDGMKKRLEDGDSMGQLTGLIRSLAKQFVKAGVRERNALLDAVHKVVSELDPTFTRRQTMDAISGYGDFKSLNKGEVETALRDLKGQMQQVAKIEDMQAKKAPSKTGVERRTPSDEERRLIKEVNELKKKGGFVVTDPAKQLKSAMDAIKTRLRNEISDLDHAIATKAPLKGKKGAPTYDAEAQALKAQRDAKKDQYDALFPKAPMSDADKLAIIGRALDRSIADAEAELKSGKLYPDPAAPKLTSPQIEAKRARLEALRAERETLRSLDTARVEAAKVAGLKEQVADRKAKIASGEVAAKSGTPTVDTAELAALKEELKILDKQISDLRRGPAKTPEQIALQIFKTRAAQQIAKLTDRMARNDYGPRPKPAPVKMDKEATRLAFELNQKKQEFTKGLLDWSLANRSGIRKALDLTRDVLNTARAVMTSFDLSAVLRQGGFVALGNPVRAAKSFPAMFKALKSKEGEFAVNSEILARPNAALYAQSKLYLHDPNDPRLSKMEEAYMSRWADKIPGVGASQRAYTTFLNKLRADTFDAMAATLGKSGSLTPDEAAAVSNYINVATGRGSLGKAQQAAVALNTIFFSPRYLASRFQLLAGQPLWSGSARTRKAVAVEYGKFLAGVAIIYALGQAFGADDPEPDPKSADFGKLKFGNTRIDPLAGLAQVTRFEAQFLDNITRVVMGEKLKHGEGDFIGRFMRTKLSPQLGTAVDLAYGENLVGEDVTPATAAARMIVPLTYGDVAEVMEEQGVPKGTMFSLLALLGWGVQTYERKRKAPKEPE